MVRSFNWFGWYTPKIRVICHVLFWLFLTLLYYMNYRRLAGNHSWLFVSKDLFATTTLFYFTTSYVVNHWLLKKKFFLTGLWVVFTYFWWLTLTYIACWIDRNLLPEAQEYWQRYLSLVLDGGLLSLLHPRNLPIFILDYIYVISFPLWPRLMKRMIDQSYITTKLERDKLAMELNFLKTQISPHFLFNTLTGIYQMVKLAEPHALTTIMQLSEMMRYILYKSKKELIPLDQEIEFIKNFVQIARIRYKTDFPLRTEIQEPDEPYRILPLLLIPFVENAFKHGPDRSLQNAWIFISCVIEDDHLILRVENGVDRSSPTPEEGGAGMENVKRRLALNYPDRHALEIIEDTDRYRIKLTLNLLYHGDHLHSA